MKTSWSLNYLDRKFSPRELHEWTLRKKRILEHETDVPWSYWSAHGRRIFYPTIIFQRVDPDRDPEQVERVTKAMRKLEATVRHKSKGLLAIADEADMELREVVPVVAGMVLDGTATFQISRSGQAASFALD